MASLAPILVLLASVSNGFVIKGSLTRPIQVPRSCLFLASTTESAPETAAEKSTLLFEVDLDLETEGVPVATTEKLYEFWKIENHRDCMLTAGNTRQIEEIEVTNELLERWRELNSELGGTEPEAGDKVFKVRTGQAKFPGLTLTTDAYMGCKLVDPPSSAEYPVLESTLIKDESSAKGPAPIVWVYNTLTGRGPNEKGGGTAIKNLSKISSKRKDDTMVFTADVKLSIEVSFPKLLLKILPFSKEKTEESGSQAMTKTVKKDVDESIAVLKKLYTGWLGT